MSKLNRIDQQMVEEVLPTGTTSGTNPFDYGKVEAKRTEKKVYTQAEMDEAVKAEREDCALECDKKAQDYGGNNWSLASTCAEAIRERRKNNND